MAFGHCTLREDLLKVDIRPKAVLTLICNVVTFLGSATCSLMNLESILVGLGPIFAIFKTFLGPRPAGQSTCLQTRTS